MAEENKIIDAQEELESGIVPSLKDEEISDIVKTSFLDYSMSVIVSRALPDVRDGLKPVQRRIVYCMNDMGYLPSKPHVKSAKIVGDVMGKYHPHGDSSIYSAMVYLAQDFSCRYPLVDGHGNFGNIDGDGAAANRYTEARLMKTAYEMTKEIGYETVDMTPNYDGSLEEPSVLPARYPNLLVNGCEGIAVGMATKIPPHNLGEVIDGFIAYVNNPEITVEELMKYIKGPDFPGGGIIFGLNGIREAYKTGRGTFYIRSKTTIEEHENGKNKIIITELPYQVNKANLVSTIGQLAREKKIDGITSVKDFSKKDVRIEIETRKDVVADVVLNQLFKNTQLQVSFGVINLCIVKGVPRVLTLKEFLSNFLEFQIEIIVRRTKFLLKKAEARIHILDGFIIAHDNIDEIVEMSKESESPQDFIERLMASRFTFSYEQAKAISELTLGRLTKMEMNKLTDEKAKLEENIKEYNHILAARENQIEVVVKEISEIKTKFADKRRSEISSSAMNIEDEDLIPQKEVVITLTNKGYIKRMAIDEFRAQNRGGVGVKGLSTYNDDEIEKLVYANSHTDLLMFSSMGRIYRKRGHEIPEALRTSKGVHIKNIVPLEENEDIVSIICANEYSEDKYLFFVTKKGLVKRTKLSEFERINQNGKYAIKFKEGDNLLGVKITTGDELVLIASKKGQLVKFNEKLIRSMGRTAAGVKGMNLAGSEVVSLATSGEGDKVFVISEKGLGKLSDITEYRETNRGGKGVITIKITEKTGELVAMRVVNGDEDYLITSNKGIMVRTPLEQVRVIGRNSQGVKLINFKTEEEYVQHCTILPHQEEEEKPVEEVNEEEKPSEE